ncbi:MAG: hypothetical protein CMD82_00415 [Gammaproteobacteria bacterium]|nr:hypothetical protein [Gammaproteobacteria bacterium]
MNYVFYDFETSGTNRYFDQPIQIAAAYVNDEFEIVETLNETCKLKDGIVPHPAALLVNRIDIETLKNGQSFYEMIDKVHRKFTEWSPAIFVGYNSLFFDEAVLRQSLYQSLYDPYLTNTNNNRRADLYHIILALTQFRPGIIDLGLNPNTQKESYKLEYLAIANQVEQEQAHDAMSDVHATVGLSKIIKQNSPDFWDHCMKISSPTNFVQYLESNDIFFRAPAHPSHGFTPISFLSENPERQKELSFFDLNHDPEKYIDSKSTALISLMESKEKIIKLLEINKSPIVLGEEFMKTSQNFTEEDMRVFREKINILNKNTIFVDRLKQALVDRLQDREVNYPMPEFLETQIYAGFSNPNDRENMKIFKSTIDSEKKYMISMNFEDARYREIAYRILFNESPDVFSDDKLKERKQFFAQRALGTDDAVKWCTIDKAKKAIENIKDNKDFSSQLEFLNEIELFIDEEENKYKQYLSN